MARFAPRLGKMGGSVYAFISRFHLGDEDDDDISASKSFQSLISIVKLLDDAPFATCAEDLLCNWMARESRDIITLNATTARLFDMGLCAFRPLALTTRRDDTASSQSVKHVVHFSLHWLPKTSDAPGEPRVVAGLPDVDTVRATLTSTLTYLETKFKPGDIEYKVRVIDESDEYAVEPGAYGFTKIMYIMLALRWTVDMARCLAGGAGLEENAILDWPNSEEGSQRGAES